MPRTRMSPPVIHPVTDVHDDMTVTRGHVTGVVLGNAEADETRESRPPLVNGVLGSDGEHALAIDLEDVDGHLHSIAR